MREHKELLYLSQSDVVAAGLTMGEIIDILERVFREKGEGRTEMPPKIGIYPGGGDSFIHAMPAHIPELQSAGIKWVSAFPENNKRGLPYINGLLILNDPETGLAISVMDCVWITAKRTGAATALAARYLARPDASVVGVLGCGVQGRSNVEALRVIFPLSRVMAYDVDPGAAGQFAEEIHTRFDLDVVIVGDPKKAVKGCDIVVTAGPIMKKPHRTIQAGWLDPGAFASLVDYDTYWHPDAMWEASKFCTDDIPQLRLYQQRGYLQDIPPIYADLGEIVAGKKRGREARDERNMTVNLGLALEDMAVASLVYERALEKGLGSWLAL
ncbi:MAG: ornithine cyclodeaminase family protein [Deltaproteobacteria bacterium]|nr:ornithine cyclodeaminase family protein [Deltaproteobacteria bacterium]